MPPTCIEVSMPTQCTSVFIRYSRVVSIIVPTKFAQLMVYYELLKFKQLFDNDVSMKIKCTQKKRLNTSMLVCLFVCLFLNDNKGNNKITELRTILQRESQNS